MKPAILRSTGRKALPLLILVGVSACKSADTPTNIIFSCDDYTVYTDSVAEGMRTARAVSPFEIEITDHDCESPATILKTESSGSKFPRFSSRSLLTDALYNLAASYLSGGTGTYPDSTYGKTAACDIAYATALSLAYIDPDRAIGYLRAMTDSGHIKPDNSGMAWPIDASRIIWITAAYETYKATGDRQWLEEIYHTAKNTLADDMQILWDPHFRLMHGSVSSPERYPTIYPGWMQPADIYESMSLATNALYARTFAIMGEIADILGHDSSEYSSMAKTIETSLNNNLWIPNLGYYSEYLYGGVYPVQSQATDNLGQSLAILSGAANDEMSRSVISKTPVTQYGTPAEYPLKYNDNRQSDSIISTPVQALWNLAAAKSGNMKAVAAGLGAMYRYSVFSQTGSGNRLLYSSGIMAMIMRVFAGMSLHLDGISFAPVIPPMLTEEKRLTGFRYRKSILNISIKGTGTEISKFTIDGKEQSEAFFPADNEGTHSIEILMADRWQSGQETNVVPPARMPQTPTTIWVNAHNAVMTDFAPGLAYNVYLNGIFEEQIQTGSYSLYNATDYTSVSLVPVKDETTEGFSMRPQEYIPDSSMTIIEAVSMAKGGTGLIRNRNVAEQLVELTAHNNTRLEFAVDIPEERVYFMDICYANRPALSDTADTCPMLTLTLNGCHAGALILPAAGTGRSNMLRIHPIKGKNVMTIDYDPAGSHDPVLIDYIRLIKQ